ncbi:acetate kinase [Bradyrhizobium sp. Arg816]|uniref:acetate kinase n=1 Tax=Bradyrhizobium sp. Arg816 TaxID=2998491 RepID=UPI00249F277C|nr:acetate kinase [Bradyrhizobium sp. Arg816]MDI3565469.1 acetate kinase [Bradyrhizobium sp. Arg816]
MDAILAIDANAGGVNFQLFSVRGEGRLERQIKGRLDGLGSHPRLRASGANGDPLAHRTYQNDDVDDVPAACAVVDSWLRDELGIQPLAVGHRVAQGGPDDARPALIDDAVMARLERLIALAPLLQPHNLAPIRIMQANHPALPQVACFDTAFHLGKVVENGSYPIPHRLYAGDVRPHGFHGLCYESIARALTLEAPGIAARRVIVACLGETSSMCALKDGRSVESTNGFYAFGASPSDYSTGEIDPCDAFLFTNPGDDAAARSLRAEQAVEHLAYCAGLNAGLLAAALEGLDAFVFTGAIGQGSTATRARIAERLSWLGATLDAKANAQNARLISRRDSRIPIYVLPSDDELTIARHTLALLLNGPSPR